MSEILELMILVENVCMLIISKRIRDSSTYNFDSFLNISFVISSFNYIYVLNIYKFGIINLF